MSRYASRARPLLGTFVEIRASGSARTIEASVDAAYRAIERVHCLMSVHDPASELSRLNGTAHRSALAVHPWTFTVLRRARMLFQSTGGAFDPAFGTHAPSCSRRPTFGDVALLPGRLVRFARPLALDLGGIAKGFAVDRAIACLRRVGMSEAIVNAGGDLAVFGPEPSLIHVRHPADPGVLLPLGTLRDGAVATSAGYFRDPAAAIVDPFTASPCAEIFSVSVIAPDCTTADGLTKALVLRGGRAAASLARERAQGIIVSADGTLSRWNGGLA